MSESCSGKCSDYLNMMEESDYLDEYDLPTEFYGDEEDFKVHIRACNLCKIAYQKLETDTQKMLEDYHNGMDNVISLKEVGFWKDSGDDRIDPRMLPKMDPNLHILTYLKNGFCLGEYTGYSHCRFECGVSDYEMGNKDLTDGVYIWPEGLIHYIEQHNISLPRYFIDHIESNSCQVPEINSEALNYFVTDSTEWRTWYQAVAK